MRKRITTTELLLRVFRGRRGVIAGPKGFSMKEISNVPELRGRAQSDIRACLQALARLDVIQIQGKTRWTRYLPGANLRKDLSTLGPAVKPASAPTALVPFVERIDLSAYTPDLVLPLLGAIGLSITASRDDIESVRQEIKAERRRVAFEKHPDRGGDLVEFVTANAILDEYDQAVDTLSVMTTRFN